MTATARSRESAVSRRCCAAQTIESFAASAGKSEHSIRMTLSFAFLSPILAEAAMEGRLPRGFRVKRLTDLPMLWSGRAIG
jgi:site-specific DNA recombinase